MQARAAARTPIATTIKSVPAECVALILDGATACRTAHSAIQQNRAFVQSAMRVMRSITADAGRYVTAQRSIELVATIALRRAMRAHRAIATTDVCQTVARGVIAVATQQWLRAAEFAHQATGLVPP